MVIPLAVGLVGRSGADLPLAIDGRPLERGVLELTGPRQSFVFTGVAERPIPSLNRGFSAPIKLAAPIEPDELRFLARTTAIRSIAGRPWQALAMALLKANVAARRAGAPEREDAGLMAALGGCSRTRALNRCFVAMALMPPSETDLAHEIGRDVDPDAVFAARRRLRIATAGTMPPRCRTPTSA